MNKAEQPTIAQARYTVADYELAEQCVSAANVVTCDGYYEVDIEKVAETLAKARTTSLAAQEVDSGMSGDAVAIIPFTNPLLSSEVRR